MRDILPHISYLPSPIPHLLSRGRRPRSAPYTLYTFYTAERSLPLRASSLKSRYGWCGALHALPFEKTGQQMRGVERDGD